MEIFNNILCITGTELICSAQNPNGLMSKDTYDYYSKKGAINIPRRGCYGSPALIEYSSLPTKYRKQWEVIHGDPMKVVIKQPLISELRADPDALSFYSEYLKSDGEHLPDDKIMQYTNESIVIRAIKEAMGKSSSFIKACGGAKKVSWDKVTQVIHTDQVQGQFPHQLPTNTQSLRRKVKKFETEGYSGLIHAAFCNDNARKVSTMIENLMLSLYTAPNKPFGADVHTMYNMFIKGKIEVYDKTTGELFDRTMFIQKGKPIELSPKIVWEYINANDNRAIVDNVRNDSLYFRKTHRPHHLRKNPLQSLSKISMDDRDLPRRINNGQRVKAYYAYDVASGCVIGRSYSRTKDDALFLDCLRDMFQMIKQNTLPIPGEVEVEHHIVRNFKEELDMLFPIVRWCGAGNSQEKHAEHLNRAKKYGVERKRHNDIGRWWAKSEAYLTRSKRDGAEYAEKMYDYDVLVAEDIADVIAYNNELHPKQKTYTGKTRWQVLLDNVNKDLAQPSDAMVHRYIGNKTSSTITHNQYLKVQYGEYQLPTPQHIAKLKPNNYNVDAYWLPNAEGEIREVYIYQDNTFIAKCEKIDHYNTARVEWTEQDSTYFAKQSSYVSQFDKAIKSGKTNKICKLGIAETESIPLLSQTELKTIEIEPIQEESFESLLYQSDAGRNAIANL